MTGIRAPDHAFRRSNVASACPMALNEARTTAGAGFESIVVPELVGRKFVAWHDVSWWRWRVRNAPAVEGP